MDTGLTEEQQREYEEAFRDLDKNHTGFLSPMELGILMRSLGQALTDEDMRNSNITADNERCVTLNDFLSIMAKREQDCALQDALMKAFAVFDRDGSGFISSVELRTQMMALGPDPFSEKDFEDFMSEYIDESESNPSIGHPAETDGLIDYAEFIKLMLRK